MEYSDNRRHPFRRTENSGAAGQAHNDEKITSKSPQVTIVEATEKNTPTTIASNKASKYLRHLPWASLIELILVVNTVIAAALLVAIINGKEEWPTHVRIWSTQVALVTPQVILALMHSIIAFLIGLAVKDGITVAWWRNTLGGGTVRQINRNYNFGTSLLSAALSGKRVNVIALATIGAAIAALAQGPLMQRALTIYLTTENSTVTLYSQISWDLPDFTVGKGLDYSWKRIEKTLLDPSLDSLVSNCTERVALLPHVSGCNGTCRTTVPAVGLAPHCEENQEEWRFEFPPLKTLIKDQLSPKSSDIFSIKVHAVYPNRRLRQYPEIAKERRNFTAPWPFAELTSKYLQSDGTTFNKKRNTTLLGQRTTRKCTLHPAVVEYPLIILNSSSDPLEIYFDKSVNPLHYDFAREPKYASTSVNMRNYSQWQDVDLKRSALFFFLTGPLHELLATHAQLEVTTWDESFSLGRENRIPLEFMLFTGQSVEEMVGSGKLNILDPTENMLRRINDFMFRGAIFATNASTPIVPRTAHQVRSINKYRANFAYLAASVAVTTVGVALIVPAFWGWWEIGRKVSLNPIEIAEAFNAPSLRKEQPHETSEELLKIVGDRKVVFAPVDREHHKIDTLDGRRVWKMELVDADEMERSRQYSAHYVGYPEIAAF